MAVVHKSSPAKPVPSELPECLRMSEPLIILVRRQSLDVGGAAFDKGTFDVSHQLISFVTECVKDMHRKGLDRLMRMKGMSKFRVPE